MPPKRNVSSKSTGVNTPSNKKKLTVKTKGSTKGISSKNAVKNQDSKEKGINAKKKKITQSKEDKAAIKIQTFARHILAKSKLNRLKKEKQQYEELIEKLQKQAWLEMVKKQKEEDEKERKKEEAERKKKKEEFKWKKDILEAAFDGEVESIKKIIKQVMEQFYATSKLSGTVLENQADNYKLSFIECCDANDNSVLSEASAGGDVDTIDYLIKNGALINSLGQFHRTPIYRAAFAGHFEAVKVLLENGADPRIQDNDGVSPVEITAVPEIVELISTWDITKTDSMLKKYNLEKEKQLEEERMQQKKDQERIEHSLKECEKEYANKQKLLQSAYMELNKRIYEHDQCIANGYEKTDVTLKAIEAAEEVLLKAQQDEASSRQQIENVRLEFREHMKVEDDSDYIKCHIRELDDILMKDVGNRIKESGKWPLLIDSTEQAVTFLRYRDTNYLNTVSPKNMEHDTVRMAILGAIRYGKPVVFDMMDVNMMEFLKERFDEIETGLFNSVVNGSILKDKKFLSLVREKDGKDYNKNNFSEERLQKFLFVLITKIYPVPEKWKKEFYSINIITASQ